MIYAHADYASGANQIMPNIGYMFISGFSALHAHQLEVLSPKQFPLHQNEVCRCAMLTTFYTLL